MAYQPKSYRKFVATAATATLVAGAIAPLASAASFTDVAPKYKDAVDFVVSKGVKGLTDTQFGVSENIKRVDAAVMLVKVLGLDTEKAPASGFTDVPARAAKEVNALKAAGITSGKTATQFGANDLITRGELAVWIQKGFELKGTSEVTFTDVPQQYKAAVSALVDNKVTSGINETQFGTNNNAKRGDFAIFLMKANDAVNAAPAVESVSAVNSTTLTVTGTGLQKITAEQLSLAGNKVTAVTPSADGKSATVTLENKLAPNAEYTLKTKIDNVEKEFKFTFGYVISKVTINEATFDDDRAGQKVTFKINNESVNADIDDLKAAGYDVDFVAVDDKNAAANIFTDGASTPIISNKSKTGALTHPLTKGAYKVEVQISKGGVILVSDSATINVVNIDAEASAIKSVVFAQYGKDKADGGAAYGAAALAVDDIKMNSTTLVAGEKAEVQKVEATISGEDTVAPYENVVVTSSNPSVISVVKGATAADGIVLSAEAKGSATITVKVGAQTKTYNFTVANEVRELKAVTANPGAVTVVKGKTATTQVKTTDQYGDPFEVATADIAENIANATLVSPIDVVTGGTPNSVGTTTLTITAGANAGSDTVFFQDKAVKPTKTYGTLAINVTAVDNVGSQKLEIASDSESTDATLNLSNPADNEVKYNLKTYNSNGVFVENADLANYTVAPVNTDIVTVTPNAKDFVVTAKAKGTTDVVVTETATGKFVGKVTVTVAEDPYKITNVSWKTAPTSDYHGDVINYKDVLDVVSSNDDDIVNGITLSKTTQHKVRIVEGTTDTGTLYLDINADGKKDATDIVLGALTIGNTTDSNFTVSGNSIAGYTTAVAPTKDKGTIIFKVLTDAAKPETAVSSTSVKVEVK